MEHDIPTGNTVFYAFGLGVLHIINYILLIEKVLRVFQRIFSLFNT
ncbi:hypothetical protein AR1Y2_1055 [Anaerostipes rhamnosivorans]|uniref:Uncharacterized protein n=1 Tax=Anaerostipes rhamnosivorans TaxID=1229621 RepID=A0A4P8IH92_9FIRM|nr:hypothetical protein AR1Y2_1055 [Anaerostipes rhamnosivorans]